MEILFTSFGSMYYDHLSCAVPPLSLLLSATLFGIILHSGNNVKRRYLLLPFLSASWLSIASPQQFWFSSELLSLWNLSVLLYTLQSISLLYIEKAIPTKPPPGLNTYQYYRHRISSTYRLWGNPRLLPRQIEAHNSSPLSRFVAHRTLKLTFYYYAHTALLPHLHSLLIGPLSPSDVNRHQSSLLVLSSGALTLRSLVIRAHTSIYWIWESLVFLDGANALLSLLSAVILRIDSPGDWPPLFGSPSSATSLSNFWSKFWHRLPARPYKNIGRFVAVDLLSLQPRSTPCNLLIAAIVFALSGGIHSFITWQGGYRDWWRELAWYMLNFGGCTAERLVKHGVRRVAKKMGWSAQLKRIEGSCIGSLVGYLWVLVFFMWSVPFWKYPRLLRQTQVEILTSRMARRQR